MIRYLLCIGLCAVVWIANIKDIILAVKKRMPSEIFIHTGLALFFSIMVIEWTLGTFGYWERLNIFWIKILGFVLFIPSACLVWRSHEMLKHKANPEGGRLYATTVFVDSGIYGIVRQPMTLGMAIWSIALIFVFQSLLSLILGLTCVLCFWLSAKKEGQHNISKFGDAYRQYIQKVPMWNILSGLTGKKRVKKTGDES